MKYARLGRSGLTVSRLVLGSTMFGELMDEAAARAVLHRAWDLGVHTIDTGNIYAGSRAEEIIGRLTQGRRRQLVICTKVGFRVGDDPAEHARALQGTLDDGARWAAGIAPHDQGLSRQHILQAVEDSLRRLRTDYIDLYQLHRWDASVPIEETLRALDDLVRAGKVRYIGCSNARAWQLYEALWKSDRHGLARFDSIQAQYSMLMRQPEADLFPACEHAGVSVIAFSALAGGMLSGAHDEAIRPGTVLAARPGYQQQFVTAANRERMARFADFAARLGRPRIQLALDAVFGQPAVAAATVGVQHPGELDPLVAALDHPMSPQDRTALLEIFAGA
ncbi:MAG: aldo/keto reductase [Gammaproteobacteria bacterium]